MKSQPMLQTNVRRNHTSYARKIRMKIVENRKFMQEKEPTTNGFGVAPKVRNPLKILAFCKDFQSIKTQNAML